MRYKKCKISYLIKIIIAQELYVGANYHPHDNKQPDKIKKDIQLMKAAGFNVSGWGIWLGTAMNLRKENLILNGLISYGYDERGRNQSHS
jgi:hypothetical protein